MKRTGMKKGIKIFLPFCVIALALQLTAYTDIEPTTPQIICDYRKKLQKIVDVHWNNYIKDKPDYPGGYALQISTGDIEYYITTGKLNGTTNQVHFREAGTTKTFTAAATDYEVILEDIYAVFRVI